MENNGILNFVEELNKYAKTNNNIKLKECFNKLKIKHYIPYALKVNKSKAVITKICFDDEGRFIYDSPKRFIAYVMVIVTSYTGLECMEDDISLEYDALKESGALKEILQEIGEEELVEFKTVWNMVYDDLMIKENSIPSLITKTFDRFAFICNEGMEKLGNSIANMTPEKMSGLLNGIRNFAKK